MINLNNVTMKFHDKKKEKIILDGYNYTFEDNKIYCIMGKSGCGKSTMLRLIAGLIKPQQGEILYNGTKVHTSNPDIFMMHQNYSNFDWKTSLDNVLLPISLKQKITEEHEELAITMLKTVGLEDAIEKYPYEMSGGMKQRLALARTLIMQPKVILMDEPLSALDPKTRSSMQNLLLDLHYKTKNTIIMVTHDVDEANKMKDVLINL